MIPALRWRSTSSSRLIQSNKMLDAFPKRSTRYSPPWTPRVADLSGEQGRWSRIEDNQGNQLDSLHPPYQKVLGSGQHHSNFANLIGSWGFDVRRLAPCFYSAVPVDVMQVFCRQNHLTIYILTHRMISHGIRMEANDMFEITSTASSGSTWDLKKHVRRYEWKK